MYCQAILANDKYNCCKLWEECFQNSMQLLIALLEHPIFLFLNSTFVVVLTWCVVFWCFWKSNPKWHHLHFEIHWANSRGTNNDWSIWFILNTQLPTFPQCNVSLFTEKYSYDAHSWGVYALHMAWDHICAKTSQLMCLTCENIVENITERT